MYYSDTNPKVVVVLVNYNGKRFLPDCLSSIRETEYLNYEIVAVDNASKDGSAELIMKNYPKIVLIRSKKNRGLGAGINQGIKYALKIAADYILFINTDTIVAPCLIDQAVLAVKNNPRIGILGFTEYGIMTGTSRSDYLKAVQENSNLNISYVKSGPGTQPFFMINMKAIKMLGGFDEKYFAYGDDNDFELRMIRAGFKLAKINFPCFHHGMGSFKPFSIFAARLAMRNTLRLHLIHSSPRRIIQIVGEILNYSCNPFLKYNKNDIQFRRFRPSSIFVNLMLFIYVLGWNAYNIPLTLATRKKTAEVIKRCTERIIK